MKIRCQKADLLKGVNFVSKAVPTKTTMAILECILIDASSGEIKLTANNMELGIETIINGTIEERGIVALDAKIFSDIVRKLPDNEVTIETDASFNTKITCEKAKFFNVGKSGEDFSYIPVVTRNQPIIISQYTLREIIRKTIFTVPDKDNNKMMTGELLEIKDGKLKAVALDGHRDSIRYVDLKDATNDVNVVVPKNTLNEIIKIIDGGVDDFVNIFVTDNHIVFEFDQTTVVSRIIQGEFFKIEQMLSADYETKI
ncbi:MAG: DNA polymerase III subunit beta, partial [Methanobrevibacter sp.]|nr:DNA polymerase III subunit beta [Methanobrevibacter sp.]